MNVSDPQDGRRGAGRPRSEAADEAILDAALAEFAACGFDGMRIEAVAARAGVAKTTLYRRFPTKLDLVHHALATTADELACPHTDSLVDDLTVLVTQLRNRFSCPRLGVVVPALVQAISRHETCGSCTCASSPSDDARGWNAWRPRWPRESWRRGPT